MSKRVLGVLAALLFAIAGTAVLTAYVRSAEDRALAGEEVVEVFVVDKFIEAGASPAEVADSVRVERVPTKVRAQGAVGEFDNLEGLVSAVDLVPGEQVVNSRFIAEASFDEEESTLTAIPPGFHEVTIALEPQRAVGGELRPGDSVGVLGSFDSRSVNGEAGVRWVDAQRLRDALDLVPLEVITSWFGLSDDPSNSSDDSGEPQTELSNVVVNDLDALIEALQLVSDLDGSVPLNVTRTPIATHFLNHKVLVTRVQLTQIQETVEVDGKDEPTILAPTDQLLVTLALPTEDIEDIIFAAEFGHLWLTAEPSDASEGPTEIVTRENVFAGDDPDGSNVFTRQDTGQ